jgi:pimeloyl-ACP methyl ester carboxylesterase
MGIDFQHFFRLSYELGHHTDQKTAVSLMPVWYTGYMNDPKNNRTKKRRWAWIIGGIFLVIGVWHFFTTLYQEQEKQLLRHFRETVKEIFPEQTAEFSRTFGLTLSGGDRESLSKTALTRKSVVLVHGLDDPGKVWRVLEPELVKEEYNVWLLRYPNDQPIRESARMFLVELKGLTQLGIQRISIVAHSMGGLVSREMLTNPKLEYEQLAKDGQVPEVATLIMVGTPNHGSQLVRFRVFSEIRDHWARLTKGQASWLGAILDGAGEAKIDLLPGSRFLTDLNAQPHPEGLKMLIIAGIAGPWNEKDIDTMVAQLRQKVSDDRQKWVDDMGEYMSAMTHGLGDGLVTVESTRLEGIRHRTVDGTHLSMIRNVTKSNPRIPPAVPIILDELKGSREQEQHEPEATHMIEPEDFIPS